MIPDPQRLKVVVEFEYEPEVYDGDPVDAFALAELEKNYIEDVMANAGIDLSNNYAHHRIISIKPILTD